MDYKIERYKSEAIVIKRDGMNIFSADIGQRGDNVSIMLEDDGEVVDMEVTKEAAVEFFAGIINILAGM